VTGWTPDRDSGTPYPLPELIRDAARHGELVVFVGAGASMLCGSPDWRGFAAGVVKVLTQAGVLNFLDSEQLNGLGDPRRTLSIAMDLARKHSLALDIEIDKILHPVTGRGVGLELYALLARLRPVFVTTNYDKWLDSAPLPEPVIAVPESDTIEPRSLDVSRPKYHLAEQLTSEKLSERGAVIHLHGSHSDVASMIVSLRDYIRHYTDLRIQTFLKDMFRDHTVLFIGYGLVELEVLEHIVRSNVNAEGEAPRHFVLYPYRSSEEKQTRFTEAFFRDHCGVQLIKYCIDHRGYEELLEVLKAWEPQLDVRDPTVLELQAQIDRFLKDPGNPNNRRAAIQMVLRYKDLSTYFMNSLADPIWFEELDAYNLFDPSNNPPLKEVVLENGTGMQADWWPALRYLENVAGVVSTNEAKRVAVILRSITNYSISHQIDNWRTWWSLAEIYSKLPLEVVDIQDSLMIRKWLRCRPEANMVGRELGGRLLPRLLESKEPTHLEFALTLVAELIGPRDEV
jgi:hypothetical protein